MIKSTAFFASSYLQTETEGDAQGRLLGHEKFQEKENSELFSLPYSRCLLVLTQLCLILCDPMDCVACEAPLSVGFPRQEHWSGLPFPSPGDLPDPGIKPVSLVGRQIFFYHSSTWEAPYSRYLAYMIACHIIVVSTSYFTTEDPISQ